MVVYEVAEEEPVGATALNHETLREKLFPSYYNLLINLARRFAPCFKQIFNLFRNSLNLILIFADSKVVLGKTEALKRGESRPGLY